MIVNAKDILDAMKAEKNTSRISGLSKIDGDIYDTKGKHVTLSEFHEKIFEVQQLANTRLLQYYNQLTWTDEVACSLEKSSLQTLHKIYSLKLRPSHSIEVPLVEKVLLEELLLIISRTYRIQGDSDCPIKTCTIEGRGSPLWELNDLSLKLIRVFIDSGLLSADMAEDVENCLTDVIITTHQHYLWGPVWPFTSSNFALLAHCLCKLLQVNNSSSEDGQRRLLSPSFIRDHLFPLACEFAAREYPATIIDPIGHYELFEKSGKLSEPDEALGEWNRRNEGKSALKNSVDNCGDLGGNPLPSAHACLEYLIYRLALSSTEVDRGIIVNFLGGKTYRLDADNYGHDSDGSSTGVDCEALKLAVMNKVVALNVLGRVMLHLKSEAISTFLKTKALPTLPQDCLLMKICKFQLLRYWCTDETEDQSKLLPVFLKEFRAIEDIVDFQDERNKLFVIFTCVAADILFEGDDTCSRQQTYKYLKSLRRKAQLSLVKKVVTLYLDYKIITPLMLVGKLVRINIDDNSFKSGCERQLTRAIDQIANHFLTLFSTDRRYTKSLLVLSASLYLAAKMRKKRLPDKTVEKLLKIAEIRLLDDDPSMHQGYERNGWNIQNKSYLEFALKYPLGKRSHAHAMRIFDRLLDSFQANNKTKIAKMTFATMNLANLSLYQVINSLTSDSCDGDKCRTRDLLFESPNRIGSICEACELIKNKPVMISCWVMSILMSWPSSYVAVETTTPGTGKELDIIWQRLVKLTLNGLGEFELTKESYGFNSGEAFSESRSRVDPTYRQKYQTRVNILYALIAAFNHEPKLLESCIIRAKGPSSNGDSHILRYVKFWLDSVMRQDDFLFPNITELTIANRSYVLISFQALVNIHRGHTFGELEFSIDELKSKLNSARRIVLDNLSDLCKKANRYDSQLKDYYADSIRQLEAIGEFK